ncbi:MAG: hypothetical protein WBB65_00985 [Anaerolineales bacterium]
MFNQVPRNEEIKTVVQAAAGLSPEQSTLLGEFLQGKCRPPDWPEDYWLYLQSGEAQSVELANLLDLRLAFGEPFLTAIRMTDCELIESLSAWLVLDAMTDIARKLFG